MCKSYNIVTKVEPIYIIYIDYIFKSMHYVVKPFILTQICMKDFQKNNKRCIVYYIHIISTIKFKKKCSLVLNN